MFSGIVQAVGRIVRLNPLEIESGALGRSQIAVGASICVQGVCLTVTTLIGYAGREDFNHQFGSGMQPSIWLQCSIQPFSANPNDIWCYIVVFCKDKSWGSVCLPCIRLHAPGVKQTS